MSVLKRSLLLILLLAVVAYMVLAITAFSRKPEGMVCEDVEFISLDTTATGFITKREILTLLTANKLNPIGVNLDSVNTNRMEELLATHPAIKSVDCYKSPSGKVCINISPRIPVLRVMAVDGEDYFVDGEGSIIPSHRNIAHIAVVTGRADKDFVSKELYKFGVFLQRNEFWNSQIEQINVLSGNNIELVPRVGDHLIYMGKMDSYQRKLERLRIFYRKVLNEIGWNKYSKINIEFSNQIVCTKR